MLRYRQKQQQMRRAARVARWAAAVLPLVVLLGALIITSSLRGPTLAALSDQVAGEVAEFSAGQWVTGTTTITPTPTATPTETATPTGTVTATDTPTPTAAPTWDKSSLVFVAVGVECTPDGPLVWATVRNEGEAMARPVPVELWYAQRGNPKNGVLVAAGEISPLGAGAEVMVKVLTTMGAGRYKFRVFQHPAHPGQGSLWSEDIRLAADQCPASAAGPEETPAQAAPAPTVPSTPTDTPAAPATEAPQEPPAGEEPAAQAPPPTATPSPTPTVTPAAGLIPPESVEATGTAAPPQATASSEPTAAAASQAAPTPAAAP